MNKIIFKKTSDNAILPKKSYSGDLGWDLFSSEDILIPSSVKYSNDIKPIDFDTMGGYLKSGIYFNNATLVSTDIICKFPDSVGGIIRDRSSISTTTGLFIVAGVLDSGYRGIIKIAFRNLGEEYQIHKGDKIAQMILVPVLDYESNTEESNIVRGEKGFGSSDNK